MDMDADTVTAVISAAVLVVVSLTAFLRGSNRNRARLAVDVEILSKLPPANPAYEELHVHITTKTRRLIEGDKGRRPAGWMCCMAVLFGLLVGLYYWLNARRASDWNDVDLSYVPQALCIAAGVWVLFLLGRAIYLHFHGAGSAAKATRIARLEVEGARLAAETAVLAQRLADSGGRCPFCDPDAVTNTP